MKGAPDPADRRLRGALQQAHEDLKAGRVAEMFERLARARKDIPSPPDSDAEGWLARYQLELRLTRYADAAAIGDRLLDRGLNFHEMQLLRWPFFEGELDFLLLPRAFKSKVMGAAARYASRAPRSPWARYFRFFLARQLAEAYPHRKADARALASVPARYGWMRYELGKECLSACDFPEAIAHFKAAAAALSPGDWDSQCYLAEARLCQGDLPAAMKAFDLAESWIAQAKDAPPSAAPDTLAWRGELLLWAGEFRRALEVLEKACGLSARYAPCWRAGALVMLGRATEALPLLDEMVARAPYDFEARVWRGEALVRLGRPAEALRELDASDPHNAFEKNLYFHGVRALAYQALGDAPAVRREFEPLACGSPLMDFLRREAGLRARGRHAVWSDDSDAALAKILKTLFALSRGVRRVNYELCVWAGPSGRPQ